LTFKCRDPPKAGCPQNQVVGVAPDPDSFERRDRVYPVRIVQDPRWGQTLRGGGEITITNEINLV
jgi:hypothetical protein